MENKPKKVREVMRITSRGDVYVDGELVPKEILLSVYRKLLGTEYPWNKEKKEKDK